MMLRPAFDGAETAEILNNIAWARHDKIDAGWSKEL